MKTFLSIITFPFRWFGRLVTFLRTVVLNLFFLFLVLMIVGSLMIEKKPIIKKNSALMLTIAGDVVEEEREIDPLGDFINEALEIDEFPSEILLQDILDVIHYAASDSRISCIVLDLKKIRRVGLDQLQVIGEALNKFKGSGKQVIAADDSYTQKQYYLASYANKIFLNPAGAVHISGFGLYKLYFRNALKKLKINFNVFRVGEYKSATEIFTRDSMSPNARQQNRMWLTSLWTDYTESVTSRRSLPPKSLDNLANNISTKLALTDGDATRLALESGLVDEVKSRAEIRLYLAGLSAPDSIHDFRQISFKNYLKTITRSYQSDETAGDKIGIIVAAGNILTGKRPVGSIGADSLSATLRRAKHDPSIKAVVIRVNSGGGSAFASEIIRDEILDLKKSGKPVVISMGSMAASGGYMISADADEIWASPVTLTGSIGVFGLVPTFENTLSELGIQSDGIGTTNIASSNDLTRPLTPMLKEAIQLRIQNGYDRFLTIVSKGRNLDLSLLDSIAQGKVFTGKKAQELGLVDKLGTLADAIESAAQKASLEEYSAQYISRSMSLKDKLLHRFQAMTMFLFETHNFSHPLLEQVSHLLFPLTDSLFFDDPNGLYAYSMLSEIPIGLSTISQLNH